MYCMRCGKETGDNQVFCTTCLATMQEHPVNPGTAVLLPNRTAPEEKKAAPKKRPLTQKQLILRFRKATKWLSIALASTLLLLSFTVALLVHTLEEQNNSGDIGKNYNTVSTIGKTG